MGALPEYGTSNEAGRENWIRQKLLGIPTGHTILDAGAGDQKHKWGCQHLKYVSQDFAKYDGKGDSKGLQTGVYNYGELDIVSDITKIPRADKFFDAILCSEVLEHIPHPELAIKEFSRLLTTGGTLLLTAPFCSLTHFAPYYYANGFSQYWYSVILLEHGFKIEDIQTYGNYFEYLAQEMHRLPHIISYNGKGIRTEEELDLISNMIKLLQKYGEPDETSHELLNFGMLVTAVKQ